MRLLTSLFGIVLLVHVPAAGADVPPAPPRRLGAADGISRAVVVGDVPLLHTAQLLPLDDRGRPVGDDPAAQVRDLFRQLATALKAGGSSLDRLVRLHFAVTDQPGVAAVRQALARQFRDGGQPAVTIVVGRPVRPGVRVSLDAVAVTTGGGKQVRFPAVAGLRVSGGAGVSILPAGPTLHVSGQAERGKTLADSTRQTMRTLRATLRQYDRDLEHVALVKAFVEPMDRVEEARREIEAFFGNRPVPPIVLVEWTFANSIEIELVASAAAGTGAAAIDYLTPPGMTASPVFSRVARINHGNRVYTSGLIGGGRDGAAQVKDVFVRLKAILGETGSDLRHLAKATYYVSTEDASKQLNLLRPNYYDPKRPPAASKAPVRGVGHADSGIVVDMIAVSPAKR